MNNNLYIVHKSLKSGTPIMCAYHYVLHVPGLFTYAPHTGDLRGDLVDLYIWRMIREGAPSWFFLTSWVNAGWVGLQKQ